MIKQTCLAILLLVSPLIFAQPTHNILSKEEQKQGWKLLFDGKNAKGWRGAYKKDFPEEGWIVKDGALLTVTTGGAESAAAGDIVTAEMYGNFDLKFEWKLFGSNGNSGVKYFVEERMPKPQGSAIGCEYQLIDDENYIYNGKKLPEKLKTASLYEVFPATEKNLYPVGEWNQSRIMVKDKMVQHWLNGVKVLEYDRTSQEFSKAVAESKFKDYPEFGQAKKGHILLQDHGHSAAFRNIKIKPL